jgi:hypothetical protein
MFKKKFAWKSYSRNTYQSMPLPCAFMHTCFTYYMYIPPSCNRRKTLALIMRECDPEAADRRLHRGFTRELPYTTDGPNFLWHADQHDKLKYRVRHVYDSPRTSVHAPYVIYTYSNTCVLIFFSTQGFAFVGMIDSIHISFLYYHF